MIVASFASQYGIRVLTEQLQSMSWDEFSALLRGLDSETPLGRIVRIRSEEDGNVLKTFTPQQHKIRNEWRSRGAKNTKTEDMSAVLEGFRQAFISLAGGR